MTANIVVKDLGIIPYKQALSYQLELFNANLEAKNNQLPTKNTLLLCEHHSVYTIGKSGSQSNLLLNKNMMGAEVFNVERGGDVTYHGPGQITGYPIFDLEVLKLGLKQYIWILEDVFIRLTANHGIIGERIPNASGVWIDANGPKLRKIAAIGVKLSRNVTMHGFAFNVNTDLSWFNKINPCGFTDRGVTSLSAELDANQKIELIKQEIVTELTNLINEQSN